MGKVWLFTSKVLASSRVCFCRISGLEGGMSSTESVLLLVVV
jgi:hypothetical protein